MRTLRFLNGRPPTAVWLPVGLLLLSGLACTLIGLVDDPAPLAGVAYWAAQTATPRPTVTVFLGTTTPVYADTPVPGSLTTTPFWTTVTATSTPFWATATATPWGFTATPLWLTTTPETITETPPPPVTTTPGLPIIGFTTPEPTETPYYRVGSFYMNSDVTLGELALRLVDHRTQPSPNDPAAAYHYLTVQVTNNGAAETLVPLSDLFFIRRVQQGGAALTGRWLPANEPLIAAGLPGYADQQLAPIPAGGRREIVLGFVAPAGMVSEAGLITNWQQPLEGGLPVWFLLQDDPLGPFTDATLPPPPTSVLLDDDLAAGGGSLPAGTPGTPGAPGSGRWPTTGVVTRGFGCSAFYTGVNGAGYGCPPDEPWFHNGVDIANGTGTAVWAPTAGSVLYAGPDSAGADCSTLPGAEPPYNGLGSYQKLSGAGGAAGNTVLHYFGHLSAFTVTAGPVDAGQQTAAMGSSGCSTGPHLHWIVYQNGLLVDPAVWAGPGPSP